MDGGLFAYMVPRFSSHPENLAIEALNYLVHEHPTCRSALERWFQQFGCESESLHWQTQYSTEPGAIPDLVGIDALGKLAVVVEAKFWAALTDNQPITYLEQLRTAPPGVLVFLAPGARDRLLWGQLLRRLADAGHRLGDVDREPSSRSATLADGRVMALASWSTLLAILEDAAIQAAEPIARNDVSQLSGLCARMDSDAFLPLRPEELSGFNGRRVLQFCDLVNRSTEELVRRDVASLTDPSGGSLTASSGTYFWGRYMNIVGVTCLLKFAPTPWSRNRDTPIWLQVGYKGVPPVSAIRDCLVPFEIEGPDRVFAQDRFVDIAIDLVTGGG